MPQRLLGELTAVSGGRRRAADERREQTVAMLNERGAMSPGALAEYFGVSVMTVHRDLNELQRRGIILKSHGGVTPQPAEVFESTMAYREGHMVPAKRALAARAAGLITAGSAVMFDDSTTVAHLVPHLADRAPLTAATNALSTLRPLAQTDGISLICLGGEYDPFADAFLGLTTERDIAAVRVDIAFLSATGVVDGCCWHGDQRTVAIKRAMITAAERAYLLVDHTKLGRSALHEVAGLEEFTAVLVDADADPAQLRAMRAAGATVETV